MDSNQLYHHGVVGMKWGVRRYQNKDGSLTPAGKKRVSSGKSSSGKSSSFFKKKTAVTKKKPPVTKPKQKEKSVKDMTDEELKNKIARLELEKRYSSLNPKQVSAGRKFVDEVIVPVAKESSKRLLTDLAIKEGKKLLGLDSKSDDSLAKLEKTVKELELKRKYDIYTKQANK